MGFEPRWVGGLDEVAAIQPRNPNQTPMMAKAKARRKLRCGILGLDMDGRRGGMSSIFDGDGIDTVEGGGEIEDVIEIGSGVSLIHLEVSDLDEVENDFADVGGFTNSPVFEDADGHHAEAAGREVADGFAEHLAANVTGTVFGVCWQGLRFGSSRGLFWARNGWHVVFERRWSFELGFVGFEPTTRFSAFGAQFVEGFYDELVGLNRVPWIASQNGDVFLELAHERVLLESILNAMLLFYLYSTIKMVSIARGFENGDHLQHRW